MQRIKPYEPPCEIPQVARQVAHLRAVAHEDQIARDDEEEIEQRTQGFERVLHPEAFRRGGMREMIEHDEKRGEKPPDLEQPVADHCPLQPQIRSVHKATKKPGLEARACEILMTG